MSWIMKLHNTYEQCVSNLHFQEEQPSLLPVGHSTQQGHIRIVLNDQGKFLRANEFDEKTRVTIPVTEKSLTGRTSGPAPHPLMDKIQYCAKDYPQYGNSKSYFSLYEKQLAAWCAAPNVHPKAKAVLAYVRQGRLVQDLLEAAVLHNAENGPVARLWKTDLKDIFICWSVEAPGEPDSDTWTDLSLQNSWIQFDAASREDISYDLCYVSLQNKIDFAVIIMVSHSNPNGDPLNGNRPRTDYAGFGEISDVCLKRKLRDRLQENGCTIFVQSDDRKKDGMKSLRERAEDEKVGLGKKAFGDKADKEKTVKDACAKWFDVKAFGQLFAFGGKKKNKGDTEDADGVSIPIRGPVTIRSAFSVEPVSVSSIQITKSVSGEGDGSKRSSDTMGMKHRVDKGVYVAFGSMNPQLAEKTDFSDADAETIKGLLPRLFENDASSARPDGSMAVAKVIWWKHNCKPGQYSSAKVHGSLTVNPDGTYTLKEMPGLKPDEIDGF